MHLTIRMRIAVSVGILGLLMLFGGANGVFAFYRNTVAQKAIYENQFSSSIALARADAGLSRGYLLLSHVTMAPGDPAADDEIRRARLTFEESDRAWNGYMQRVSDSEERHLVTALAAKRTAFATQGYRLAFAAWLGGQKDAFASIVSVTMKPLLDATEEDVANLQAYQAKNARQAYEMSQNAFRVLVATTCIGLAVALGAAFYAWWSLQRAISRPLREALGHFGAIAQGDLTTPVDSRSNDEMGQLLSGLQSMQASLSRTVGAVREGALSISTATGEIAAGNTDLSLRTEEQAASLEQTTASMEQMTATVRRNADSARHGSDLAREASAVAGQGREVVGRVVETMKEIELSASKMGEIIGVIEGIAFQTNILALNAAVEAARAGEDGRGFAVVAGEVRSLAQRAAAAAKEIKDLIDESVQRVASGAEQVGTAGETMKAIIDAVRRVDSIMDEIASASHVQSDGIDQISKALAQMDQVTQQNAALVEQAAAAAVSLEQHAVRMRDAVSVFRIAR